MLGFRDVLAYHERYRDRVREAERVHLARQVLAEGKRQHRRSARMVSWLGCQLVTWGCRLQERYGTAAGRGDASVCESRPAHRCAMGTCNQ